MYGYNNSIDSPLPSIMKSSFCALLFYLSLVTLATAQSYQPFIQENVTWQNMYIDAGSIHIYSGGLHYYIGDTVSVSGVTYHELNTYALVPATPYRYDFYIDTTSKGSFGLIREDIAARKVYHMDVNGGPESILFDFSLAVGDTLLPCYINVYQPLIVTSIQWETFLDGSTRRQWVFDNGFNYTESLGSSQGYFVPMQMGLGFYYTQGCHTVDSLPLYPTVLNSPITDRCYTYLHQQILPAAPAIRVYPNPAQKYLTIERPQETRAPLVLYNAIGQVVLSTVLEARQETVALGTLPAGWYTYRIGERVVGMLVVE